MPQDVMQQVRDTIAKCDEVLARSLTQDQRLRTLQMRLVLESVRKAVAR